MAKFLTTRGTSSQIEDIINNAKNRITLISPYVKIPDTLFKNLKVADKRNVEIILVYGKVELKPDVKNQLKQLNNLSLRFLKELHAKCFFNEERMVITSLNLHEYSQQHNREMGVLLRLKADQDIFREAQAEAEFIVNSAEEYKLRRPFLNGAAKMAKSLLDSAIKDEPKRPKSRSHSHLPKSRLEGSCIRCKSSIPFNLGRPYCRNCASEWKAKGGNPDYRERDGKCHACGEPAPTKRNNPLCRLCRDKYEK